MRRIACIAAAAAALTPARPACAEELPMVVWVAQRGSEADAVFPIAAAWVEELRILVVREESLAPIDDAGAERALAAHRAVAVIWHDAAGALRVLFAGAESSERVAAAAGGTAEEGLYLRELLAARLAVGPDIGAALVTVPEEIVEARGPPPAPGAGVEARARAGVRPGRGWEVKIGAGYFASAHLDAALWWQQGVRLAAPALRPADPLQLQLELELGFPASVGEEDRLWLELRSVCASAGVSLLPLRRSAVEIEAGLSAGPIHTRATAFLTNGESDRAEHTAGHATGMLALVLHPARRVDLRLRFDLRYVIRPPSFGIDDQGDFGAQPWQPGGGVDLAVALFPK